VLNFCFFLGPCLGGLSFAAETRETSTLEYTMRTLRCTSSHHTDSEPATVSEGLARSSWCRFFTQQCIQARLQRACPKWTLLAGHQIHIRNSHFHRPPEARAAMTVKRFESHHLPVWHLYRLDRHASCTYQKAQHLLQHFLETDPHRLTYQRGMRIEMNSCQSLWRSEHVIRKI
jgi:hypothetical protein